MVPKNCIMRSFVTCNLQSPSIIKMIMSMSMRWAAHMAGTGKRGMHIGFVEKARRNKTTREELDT
jgi:hypothetical protein